MIRSLGRRLEDRATRRDLHGGNAPCVQHQEPIAVSAAQHAGLFRQRGDDVVDDLVFADRIGLLVGDIHVVTADQSDTKHDALHVPHPRRGGGTHLRLTVRTGAFRWWSLGAGVRTLTAEALPCGEVTGEDLPDLGMTALSLSAAGECVRSARCPAHPDDLDVCKHGAC